MKNLSIVLAIFCIAFLAGCAGQNKGDLKSRVPAAQYQSTNDAKTVALCVADGWEGNNNFVAEIKMRPSANGYSVWVDIDVGWVKNEAVQLVEVDDNERGSYVRYFGAGDQWGQVVDRCAVRNTAKKVEVKPSYTPSETPAGNSTTQKMRELHGLRKDGLITEEEFQKKKQELLETL